MAGATSARQKGLAELTHYGDDGDLGGFSSGAEVFVFGLEIRIVAHGNQCGHIEGIAQRFAPAPNERLALPLTGLAEVS